ncbi:DUF3696 domain-containing protein [Sodalinema gerasimenkoae]|uniref:DUF3696 domain-containing protein n=1 Tax=Sodalinema gerasimenkoae TaxID=2862348 RepID=UPI0013587970|nr:DUF3696 domain-containing protein [Sodalinema gerasimenkoae]
MNLKYIEFANYKSFSERQKIELKPITLLIGKNSSGKSSICKLFTLLENSLSGEIDEPLLLKNKEVELGEDFNNLFFGNNPAGISLNLKVSFENNIELEINLLKADSRYGLQILSWSYKNGMTDVDIDLKLQGKNYIDQKTQNLYECKFKGFIPVKIVEKKFQKDLLKEINLPKMDIDVDYIGPFRILPDRYFYLTGQTNFQNTGVTGKNAYPMLGVSKLQDTSLHKEVGGWYRDSFDGWELQVDDTHKKPLIQILLSKNNTNINITDVGQGMHQVLPLVVRAHVNNKENSLIVVEQPELHLHPIAHGDIAELFAKSAKKNNQVFIIETHSENVLLRLRKLVVENDFGFTSDDLVIYWIEDAELKGKELRKITVDEQGVLDDWPQGVFNESMKEILEMQKAIRRKEEQAK